MSIAAALLQGLCAAEPEVLLRGARRMEDTEDVISGWYLLLGAIALAAAWRWWSRSAGPALSTTAQVIAALDRATLEKIRRGEIDSADGLPEAARQIHPRGLVEAAIREHRNAALASDLIAALRKEKYDAQNPRHEALLQRLWDALRPGVTLKRISDAWEDLGFQGRDPATDFRGNGVLGLANLVYFAENHTEFALRMLAEGGHTEERQDTMQWYMLAVTGINLTSPVTQMLADGKVDRFFRGDVAPLGQEIMAHPVVAAHSQLYSSMMIHFHTVWMKHKPSVMEFNTFVEKTVLPGLPPSAITRA